MKLHEICILNLCLINNKKKHTKFHSFLYIIIFVIYRLEIYEKKLNLHNENSNIYVQESYIIQFNRKVSKF